MVDIIRLRQLKHFGSSTIGTEIMKTLLVVSLLLLAAIPVLASELPKFEDCPVAQEVVKKPAHLKLSNPGSKQYATTLRQASKQPINFAGHFVLATWGCGSGCVMGGAINVKTGDVAMLPFTVSDWPLNVTEPLQFKKDSCLLTVQGSRNEEGHGKYYYKFDGSSYELLKALDDKKN